MTELFIMSHEETQHALYAAKLSPTPAKVRAAAPRSAPQSTTSTPTPETRWALIQASKARHAEVAQCHAAIESPTEELGSPAPSPIPPARDLEAESSLAEEQLISLITASRAKPSPSLPHEYPVSFTPSPWKVDNDTITRLAQEIIEGWNGSLTQRQYFARECGVTPESLGNSADSSSPMHKLVNKLYFLRKAAKPAAPSKPAAAAPARKPLDLSEIL